jgi:hypothetical protein
MPSVSELCQRLGVKPSGSDTVAEEDVRSASGYRQALHREYIKRRPGQYPRSWLASRLGVSVSTEQRYNRAQKIQVQARYDSVLITWQNLNAIAEFEVAGTFLQDERGKKYPAKPEIAAHLLAKRHIVFYMRQRVNFYQCGDTLSMNGPAPPVKVRLRDPAMTQNPLRDQLGGLTAHILAQRAENALSAPEHRFRKHVRSLRLRHPPFRFRQRVIHRSLNEGAGGTTAIHLPTAGSRMWPDKFILRPARA